MKLPYPEPPPFLPCPQGQHVAICYRFVDLGTLPGAPCQRHKPRRRVMLSWELPNAVLEDGPARGQPYTFHQVYSWSMDPGERLRQHLENWRGIPFRSEDFGPEGCDTRDLLGKACLIDLEHRRHGHQTFATLRQINRVPKGMKPETPCFNRALYFSLEGPLIDLATLGLLSEKLQKAIQGSKEYHELTRAIAMRPCFEYSRVLPSAVRTCQRLHVLHGSTADIP